MGEFQNNRAKNDRVTEVKTDEELKMVERFKDYLLVENTIQDTQQKVSLDNIQQVREVNTRINYLQQVKKDLESKLETEGFTSKEHEDYLEKNVKFVQDEIQSTI